MRRMVDDLLTLARLDAGQMVLAREPVSLGPLLQGCVEKLAPQARAAQVIVEMDARERAVVIGDADRLAHGNDDAMVLPGDETLPVLESILLESPVVGGQTGFYARKMAVLPAEYPDRALPGKVLELRIKGNLHLSFASAGPSLGKGSVPCDPILRGTGREKDENLLRTENL